MTSVLPSPSQLGASASGPWTAGSASVAARRGRVVGELGFTVVLRHRGVGLRQPEFLTRRFVQAQLQEGVLVEHLLDFLRQLERGQLQQPDRLLQLRRQRKMLGDTKR